MVGAVLKLVQFANALVIFVTVVGMAGAVTILEPISI